jgi:hypothetical protein
MRFYTILDFNYVDKQTIIRRPRGGMKAKNLLIALVLTILVFVPLSSQCDSPKSPNDGRLLDEDAVVGVAASDPDEPGSYAEFKSDSLHVAAWLLGGGIVGLIGLRRRVKNN